MIILIIIKYRVEEKKAIDNNKIIRYKFIKNVYSNCTKKLFVREKNFIS